MQLSKCARTHSDRFNEQKELNPGCVRLASESRFRASAARIAVRGLIAASVVLIVSAQSATAQQQTEIIDFAGYEEPGDWVFTGQVIAGEPIGLVVTFGGLLEGHSVTVSDPVGLFEYRVAITESGTVTAQMTGSEVVEFYVDVSP